MSPKQSETTSSMMIRKSSISESRWPRLFLASNAKNVVDSQPAMCCASPSTTSTGRTFDSMDLVSPIAKETNEHWQIFENDDFDTSLLEEFPSTKEVRFADFPQDAGSLQVQLEEMQTRYLQEKDRRRRKERALIKIAKELAKRSKEEAGDSTKRNVIKDESSLCNEIVRLQLKNKLLQGQFSQNSSQMLQVGLAALVAGVSIGWFFATLQPDETEPFVC